MRGGSRSSPHFHPQDAQHYNLEMNQYTEEAVIFIEKPWSNNSDNHGNRQQRKQATKQRRTSNPKQQVADQDDRTLDKKRDALRAIARSSAPK